MLDSRRNGQVGAVIRRALALGGADVTRWMEAVGRTNIPSMSAAVCGQIVGLGVATADFARPAADS